MQKKWSKKSFKEGRVVLHLTEYFCKNAYKIHTQVTVETKTCNTNNLIDSKGFCINSKSIGQLIQIVLIYL